MPTDVQGISQISIKTFDIIQLSRRNDYDSSGRLIYSGQSSPGSSTGDSVWRISKRVYTGGRLTSVLYADGDSNFDNEWDEITNLDYS